MIAKALSEDMLQFALLSVFAWDAFVEVETDVVPLRRLGVRQSLLFPVLVVDLFQVRFVGL